MASASSPIGHNLTSDSDQLNSTRTLHLSLLSHKYEFILTRSLPNNFVWKWFLSSRVCWSWVAKVWAWSEDIFLSVILARGHLYMCTCTLQLGYSICGQNRADNLLFASFSQCMWSHAVSHGQILWKPFVLLMFDFSLHCLSLCHWVNITNSKTHSSIGRRVRLWQITSTKSMAFGQHNHWKAFAKPAQAEKLLPY